MASHNICLVASHSWLPNENAVILSLILCSTIDYIIIMVLYIVQSANFMEWELGVLGSSYGVLITILSWQSELIVDECDPCTIEVDLHT